MSDFSYLLFFLLHIHILIEQAKCTSTTATSYFFNEPFPKIAQYWNKE